MARLALNTLSQNIEFRDESKLAAVSKKREKI